MKTIITCNGVTEEFLWYELEVIGAQLNTLLSRIKRVEATVKARDQDKDLYVSHLLARINQLQKQLNDVESKSKSTRKTAKKEQ